MAYDIEIKHPSYLQFQSAWTLMRDAFDGEEQIKARGETYLPMKSGTAAINDSLKRDKAYQSYMVRAEFPELVAPTVRGSVGIMLKQPAKITLPASMEGLREKVTLDGLTLDALHRRIAVEMMTMGRYGLLPGITQDGTPYLAGYVAESIINWDTVDGMPNYLVLNESAPVRDRETGKWGVVTRYRECFLENGIYASRVWTKSNQDWAIDDVVLAATRQGKGLDTLPFVFIDTNDLTAEPDDVPLYGLGRLAVRIYRLDADYTFAMHMTSEPTPVAIGFDSPEDAVKNGRAPRTIGSSTLWLLPPGGDAKFLEFTGAGIEAQKTAIADALNRAVAFGAQILTDSTRTAESGDAIQLRLGNQTSLLRLVALNSAAGLEQALRNLGAWLGETDLEGIKVEPNLEFFDEPISGQDLSALVAGWQAGAYSFPSMFDRLKRGQIVPADRTPEEELELIDEDNARADPAPSLEEMGILPNKPPQPGTPAALSAREPGTS